MGKISSILSNKPLFPKEIMPLEKRKKLKALTPLPCLLTQCYKLTSLYKKEKQKEHAILPKHPPLLLLQVVLKMTYFTPYPFPKVELLKTIKFTMLNLLTSLDTLCFK